MKKSCIVCAEIKNLEKVLKFIEEYVLNFTSDEKIVMNILLSAEEIYVNIVNYAYENKGSVQIILDSNEKEIVLQFIDEGVPFNPLESKKPNIDIPLKEKEVGGLGIFIALMNMDDISYKNDVSKNIVTMKKYI